MNRQSNFLPLSTLPLAKMVLMAAVAVFGTIACNGGQQADDDLAMSDDDSANNNSSNDDANDGNGQENFVDNNAKGGDQDAKTGADANSDTKPEQLDATLDNAAANPSAAPGGNTAAIPAPEPAGKGAPAAAPAPAAPGQGAPVAGGRVRYVKEGGVQVVSAPGGSPVTTLTQGDHPVTWEENGWLRITNGMYVPVDGMSDKGIPRTTTPRPWNK